MSEYTDEKLSMSGVLSNINAISKNGQYNAQGVKYDYATADDLFEAVRKGLLDKGICVWCHEDGVDFKETKDKKLWGYFTFQLGLSINGERPTAFETCTIPTPIRGPQSVQSARTFAIKYWLRGKFMLPTGEKDADDVEQTDQVPKADDKKNTKYQTKGNVPQEEKQKKHEPWVTYELDKDFKFQIEGDVDGNTTTAKRQLYAAMHAAFETMAIPDARKVLKTNLQLMDSLPEEGKKALEEIIVERGLDKPEPEEKE